MAFYNKWKSTHTADGDLLIASAEDSTPIALIYGSKEQQLWFLAAINALSGYDVRELELLAKIRDQRDSRLVEAAQNNGVGV